MGGGVTLHGIARPQPPWQAQAHQLMEAETRLLLCCWSSPRGELGKEDPFFHAYMVHLTLRPSVGAQYLKRTSLVSAPCPLAHSTKSYIPSMRIVEQRGAVGVLHLRNHPYRRCRRSFPGKTIPGQGSGEGGAKNRGEQRLKI